MFQRNSPFGYDTSSYSGSIQSNAYSVDDMSSQVSNLSRPSGKSIYLQRRDYAESINEMMNKIQYRVEHLFTCELDGKEVQDVGDCVERLKLLDGMGRVWGQEMILEIRDGNLLLTDIETKEELESLALSSILELKAVMDSCVYNSLLTMSVHDHSSRITSVFLFQCEELRAEYIEKDLKRALPHRRETSGSRENLAAITSHQIIKHTRNIAPPPEETEWNPPSDPVSQWSAPDYDEAPPTPVPVRPRVKPPSGPPSVEEEPLPVFPQRRYTPSGPPSVEEEPLPVSPQRRYTEIDRNVDILNHIFTDIEIFMGKISAIVAKDEKKKKKKKKVKAIKGMPPSKEFESCLQKIKFGFNLLGELNGKIKNPSAQDFVHVLFSTLAYVVSHCPEDLPPSIVAPLLEPMCIVLLSEEATPDEDQLWQSLGDAWNIPSTKWPEDDEDIPTYTLEFLDGWQPPDVTEDSPGREPDSGQQNQHQPPKQKSAPIKLPPSQPDELSPSYMRVKYDFSARNHKELSISKGEVVQLLDMSKQWWKVRNSGGEEGFVPNNVLEVLDKGEKEQTTAAPSLTRRSKPDDVKVWLEHKGFSKITVRCLGVLSGSMLLGMTRDELKIVCPEEGGRVFFQLQNIKSALALASEVRPMEP
ncbi:epidermal growth factor receptor kinase substrate 8-like protein 3 [Hypomesus transpacificus]|uniref:epidermal growth factor receptor kinase substrate 8-like protein 3 n=1 Tax=Hypomesus transpacificus TaxID=137520 RepID=UPI001F085340|nr:epidermal growth factor receptor kinase substrate 8-like protein 3 [Hypomesus transpacificus]